ncbi:MAG: GTPase-associated system all-helical protein GASH [Methylotenera sp.]
MSKYNFADQYKRAGLSPGPEIIGLRQAAFDNLRRSIDISKALDLTRLYFGLEVPNGADWFRDSFVSNDPSFSMLDNLRETSLLALCLLTSALEDKKVYAGLAVVTATAGGNRKPLLCHDFIETAYQAVVTESVVSRNANIVESKIIRHAPKSKVPDALAILDATPDWIKVSEAIKLSNSESLEAIKNLTNQVFTVADPLVKQIRDLREEVSMLWWYIGGWSRALEKPFSELNISLAALMAGLDLGNLSQGSNGPAAAQAIIQRLLFSSRPVDKQNVITLDAAIEAIPEDTFKKLDISQDIITSVADICPVLTAISKAAEIGGNGAWHVAFKKASGLDANMTFEPINLAMQTYRETLLLKELS